MKNSRKLDHGYLYRNRSAVLVLRALDALLRLPPRGKRALPEHISSILIIKPDHLGDLFLTGAALPLIAARFPGCAIDLVTGSWNMPLAARLPGIRDIFTVNHWMHNRAAVPLWKKIWLFCSSFWRTLWAIRRRRHDLCLCLRAFGGNLISLGYLSGAAYLVGHGTGGLGPLLDAEARWREGAHETEHFMEVLSLAGIAPVPVARLRYPRLTGADASRREGVKRALGIPPVYSVISPCSGHPSRMFPVAYWRRLVAQFPQMLFVVSAGPDEGREAAAIADGLRNAAAVAGAFQLPDLTAFLAGAQHIHTVDSFGAHLAGASGAPTTVHCRPGGADMEQFGPLGAQVRCILVEDNGSEDIC